MTQGYFVSDLHMFSSRSLAHRHVESLSAAARTAKHFVLGGDIFDFAWTTRKSIEESLDAAAEWLKELSESAPNCQFHFLLGNHDHHPGLIERLYHLDSQQKNFGWHPYHLRIGGSFFLHGDVADRKQMTSVQLETLRNKWGMKSKRGKVLNKLYDLAVLARLHKVTSGIVHGNRRRVAKRIMHYLDHVGEGTHTGVKNIYFGHTHRAFSDYRYRDIRFHNGGAPLKGLRFKILPAETH